MPAALTSLGILRNSVTAYFSMDTTDSGGLTWSKEPLVVTSTSEVAAKKEGARKFLDFSKKGARVSFNPAFKTGQAYTLTAWVKLPAPGKHGILWKGSKGLHMMLMDWGLGYYRFNGKADEPWAKAPKEITGWHHVAVTFDGKNTQGYLDARPLAVVKEAFAENIAYIGSTESREHEHWMMCGGVDEQLFFDRALTAPELLTVIAFTKAKN